MSFSGSHKTQLQDRKYLNWAKGGLVLKYLKDGIGDFVADVVKEEHSRILQSLGLAPGSTCNLCTLKTLKPSHAQASKVKQCPIGQRSCNCLLSNTSSCPNNLCDQIYDEIVKSHGTLQPFWKNTDITKWTSHPWEIAKCFISVPGYERKQSFKDTDVAGLLHLLINCTFFQGHLSTAINLFDKIREWRNSVFHSPSMELEDQQLKDGIHDIITLLEDDKELKAKTYSKQAVLNLKNLQQEHFTITTETEAEVCRAALASITLATNELKHTRDEAIKDIAFKQEEALKKVQETSESGSARLQFELSELRSRVDKHDLEINVLQTRVRDIEIDVAKLKQAQDHQTKHLREIEHILKFKEELVRFYRNNESTIPASPLVEDHAVPLKKLYVQPPMLAFIKPNAFGQGHKSPDKRTVSSYRKLLFNDDNVSYKNIYVEANAGYGKTSFTQNIAMTWCQPNMKIKQTVSKFVDVDTLQRFDLLFLLHLRDFQDEDICLLDDLIIKFVAKSLSDPERFSEKFIKSLLRTRPCLVLCDGLDEWTHPSGKCAGKPRIPHNNYGDNFTVLTTTRPWKISTIGLTLNHINHHVEISQLDEATSEELKTNAVKLLSENSGEEGRNLTDFDRKVSLVNLGDIRLIPYILLQLIGIWFDGFTIGESKCETYSNTIEITLQRGLNKRNVPTLPTGNAERTATVPECMRHNELCNQYMNLLIKLGKLAFYALFQKIKESSLVIDSTTVLKYLTEQELEFCLKIGLLSQSKDRSKVSIKRYQVFFQHKSIQEFMAALYITSEWSNGTIKSTILEDCSSLSSILEMENLFVFVCGINPRVYTCISGELQTIVDLDSATCRYRTNINNDCVARMESYQSMQVQCLQESLRNGNDSCSIHLHDYILNKDLKSLEIIINFNKGNVKSLVLSGSTFFPSLFPGAFTSLEKLRVQFYNKEEVWLANILTESARTLKCLRLGLLGYFLTGISVKALTGLTCLQSLFLHHVELTHSYIECLYVFISRTTTLTQLKLVLILCSNHFCQYHRDCGVSLNLRRLNELRMLHLAIAPINELHLNPECLEKLEYHPCAPKMTGRACAILWQDLRASPVLSSLKLSRISSFQEMMQIISTLTRLQHLELEWIDMDDVIPLSPAMTLMESVVLKEVKISFAALQKLFLSVGQLPRSITVQLEKITMTSQEWRELLLSDGPLQYPVTVDLDWCKGPSREDWQMIVNVIKTTPTLSLLHDLSFSRDDGDECASLTLKKTVM